MTRFASPRTQTIVVLLFIVFLAWWSMKFYMDNSNDSETDAYAQALVDHALVASISSDPTGHATILAQYVLSPFALAFERVTGLYLIRGFVAARFVVDLALFAAAYVWYRRTGLGWFNALLGLVLLSISMAFALLIRGWELDKVLEPMLFLLAAVAAWNKRYVSLVVLATLAALNRETGVLMGLVALAAVADTRGRGLVDAARQWPVWLSLCVTLAIVVPVRVLGPQLVLSPAAALTANLNFPRIAYIVGGLCLLPIFAFAWLDSAPAALRRLFWLLVPAWLVLVLATAQLDQGSELLGVVALVFVPFSLLGASNLLQRQRVIALPHD